MSQISRGGCNLSLLISFLHLRPLFFQSFAQYVSQTKYRITKLALAPVRVIRGFNKKQSTWWQNDSRRTTAFHIWAHSDGQEACKAAEEELLEQYRDLHPGASRQAALQSCVGQRNTLRRQLFAKESDAIQAKYHLLAQSSEPTTEIELFVMYQAS